MYFARGFLWILMLLILTGCVTFQKDSKSVKIINLKNEFQSFWYEAKGKPFDMQIALWEKHVENKYSDLYSSLVWNTKWRKDWKEFRKKKLRDAFKKYETTYENVIQNFDSFESTLDAQIKKYKTLFSDADFASTPIYAMPSLGAFNGKGSMLESQPNQTILVFGIDFITWRNDDPNILYSHELFHIYHIEKMGVNEKMFVEEAKLSLPLWLEGFATWTSGQLNKDKEISDLMMDNELGKVHKSKVSMISTHFLNDVDRKAFDKDNPSVYKSWFGMGTQSAIKEMPNRLGYYLGYFVVDVVAKKYATEDMVNWNNTKVHSVVKKTLTEFRGSLHSEPTPAELPNLKIR